MRQLVYLDSLMQCDSNDLFHAVLDMSRCKKVGFTLPFYSNLSHVLLKLSFII